MFHHTQSSMYKRVMWEVDSQTPHPAPRKICDHVVPGSLIALRDWVGSLNLKHPIHSITNMLRSTLNGRGTKLVLPSPPSHQLSELIKQHQLQGDGKGPSHHSACNSMLICIVISGSRQWIYLLRLSHQNKYGQILFSFYPLCLLVLVLTRQNVQSYCCYDPNNFWVVIIYLQEMWNAKLSLGV